MAIMLGGAAFHAAKKLKDKLIAIAAHDLGVPAERVAYQRRQCVRSQPRPTRSARWAELVTIAHRHIHRCRPAWSPGCRSATSCRCRPAAALPTPDGRVQMYPCYSFEFHLMLVAIDPDLGKPRDQALRRRPRLRHGDQSEDRARHDHGRHRPRHRRGALRGVRLQRRRPAGGAELHGLPAAVGARGAAGRDRRITRRHRRSPCSARRARARAAISARRPRSRARSTTRCGRSASWSTRFRSRWRGLAI